MHSIILQRLKQSWLAFLFQIAFGGLAAAAMGKWTMKKGLRTSMLTGASIFGLGFLVAGAGIHNHSLPMLYTGNRKK